MSDIVTKSDDQWTQLLGKLESMQEDTYNAIQAADASTKEEMRTFKETLDDMTARVEHFEDKANNPDQRKYFGKYDVSETQDSRKALCHWLQDAYRDRFSSGAYDLSEFNSQRAVPVQEETNAGKGTETVPTPLDTEIHRIRDAAGVARQLFRHIPMTSKTLDLPTVTGDPTVIFGAAEFSTPSNSGVTFGQEQLVAKKLIALDKVSSELSQDSAVELFSVLVELFGEAIARSEDNEIFNGTGATFSGVFATASATVQPVSASFAGIDYDDVVDLMHAVDTNLIFEGTFCFHPEILKQLRKIKDANDNPIWQPGMQAGAPGTILGRPYVLANQMPSTDGDDKDAMWYGVPKRFGIIGDSRALEIKFSEEAGYLDDSRYLRVIERLAFVITKSAAFAKLVTKSP